MTNGADPPAFLRDLPTYQLVYPDTLGDLTLGTSGSLLAGLVVAVHRRVRRPVRD